jgi:glycosyltransferase involved in cell wall biosynthesis
MLVSVALASCNGEKYIREQLDSILGQTCQDFELVICDDCSGDSTWDIIREYEQKDKRIRCYRNDANAGFVKNFEKAIGLCKGDYIALSDQDDIWMEDHLETLLQNIGSSMICCGDAMLVDEDGKDMYRHSEIQGNLSLSLLDDSRKIFIHVIYGGNQYQGASMLLERNAAGVLLPVPEGAGYHDVWFVLSACANNSFVYINKVITKWRRHGENASPDTYRLSLWMLVKHTLKVTFLVKKDLSDRSIYCSALLERFDIKDSETRNIVVNAQEYFAHRLNFFYRVRILPFWIRNFQYIYLTRSGKIFVMRLVKHLFFR